MLRVPRSHTHREVDVAALPRRTTIDKRYQIKERIGEGWEGVTYLVHDRLDSRPKVLKFVTNDQRRKSVINQARVLVRLRHPNIVNYYNVERVTLESEMHYCLVTEYLQGPRLSQVIKRHFKWYEYPPVFFGLRVFYQICRGMAYVHDQRILHDDLHTDNIILTGDPEAPTPKLFDFLGSRGADRSNRRTFDLRCAGQVLFEIMTGKEDYNPRKLVWLPPEVAEIIRRAHARVHNYRSFHQILNDLEDIRDWDS